MSHVNAPPARYLTFDPTPLSRYRDMCWGTRLRMEGSIRLPASPNKGDRKAFCCVGSGRVQRFRLSVPDMITPPTTHVFLNHVADGRGPGVCVCVCVCVCRL